jgi:type II secretory pathway pseudopilin PulG
VVRNPRGFTYLSALFIVAILGAGLALTGDVWHTAATREKEVELLHVGHQYRAAIQRYFLNGPQRQYPRSLEDLLKDPRQPGTVRYLRRLQPDPVTGKDWMLVKAPDGGILGVHSPSEAAPLKVANFKLRDRTFEGTQKYSDWKFIFQPAAAPAKPGAKAGASPEAKPAAK